jgi:eukaryotic-like serine/threonine-protein kinase
MAFLIGQTIGDYTILQELGNGASGVVYKVEQTITGRREAMKILGGGTTHSSEQAERFMREIRLQASLAHPNIAAVHNAFLANDDLVLICELLQGESLQSLLARGPVPLTQGVELITQVLAALSYAHAHGVMHRDVSPANIFVTTDKTVKLIDFGLAKGSADVRLTREGSPQGSVHYMSPEQVRGLESLDVRTDIYSCGAVLYHLATGRTLFESESAFDVMKGHLEMEPPRPRSIHPNISAKLEAIILQAIAKKAEDRFQSADSFYQALKQVEAESAQPAMAVDASPWRRTSSIFAGASACLCLGFAGLADPVSVTGHDNTLAKKHAVVAKAHTAFVPVATAVATPPQSARLRTPKKAPAPVRKQSVVTDDSMANDAVVTSPQSPKQHPVKRLARSIQRLNPFSRKTDSDKSADSR